MDQAGARAELWRRFDAGDITARELEQRLQLVDAAGDDEGSIGRALDGTIPLRRQQIVRHAGVGAAAVVAVAALVLGTVTLARAMSGDDADPAGGAGGGVPVAPRVGVAVAAPPLPDIELAECPDPENQLVATAEGPLATRLLTDPPFVPEGYELAEDEVVTPGQDPDADMGVAAGTPAPDEIAGRTLDGDLPVVMRAFRYATHEDALVAGRAATESGCANAIEFFTAPDHPDVGGAVITRIIPTTVFVSWLLEDRRFVVSVEVDGDDAEDIAEAKDLAVLLAVVELEASRTPSPPPP